MSYGLIYTIPFMTLENDPCVIKIEEKDYIGSSTELQAGETPLTIDVEDEDFLYTPTRFSTAKISIVGNDYLMNLSTTSYQQHRVTLLKNGVVQWCGFVKPETYTQDYTSTTFILEIECISSLSTLEYIDYSKRGDTLQFVSLWYLLQKCIASSNGNYSSVYIPYVYSDSADNYTAKTKNILDNMLISEQNFFDEDGKAMKLKEILESICKILAWTCVDFKGSIYFVDCDHMGDYWIYDGTLTTKSGTYTPNALIVQNIGFKGGDHTLDILGGYTKVTLKDSNYPVGSIFPEETWNAVAKFLGSQLISPHAIYVEGGFQIQVDQPPKAYKVFDYTSNGILSGTYTSGDYQTTRSFFLGSRLVRICDVTDQNVDINYDDCIEIDIKSMKLQDGERSKFDIYYLLGNNELFTFNSHLPCAAYFGGCMYISGQVAQSTDLMNHIYNSSNGTSKNVRLVCKLSIGNKYWNGTYWSDSETTFDVLVTGKSKGYNAIDNTKKLSMAYSGVSGYIIQMPDTPLTGEVKFSMYTPSCDDENVTAVIIKDFSLKFKKNDGQVGITSSDSDRTYENVVNSEYVNELDEIELKISSYNEDGACYSKLTLENNYLKDNLYSAIESKLVRLEESLIKRIINRYDHTRLKLTQQINNSDDLNPICILSDNYIVNKKFIISGGTINVGLNEFECKMIER